MTVKMLLSLICDKCDAAPLNPRQRGDNKIYLDLEPCLSSNYMSKGLLVWHLHGSAGLIRHRCFLESDLAVDHEIIDRLFQSGITAAALLSVCWCKLHLWLHPNQWFHCRCFAFDEWLPSHVVTSTTCLKMSNHRTVISTAAAFCHMWSIGDLPFKKYKSDRFITPKLIFFTAPA